jgi:hypothetical protein
MSRGIKPISDDGKRSIETQIGLYRIKKERAIKFKDFRSAASHEEEIKRLQQILESRERLLLLSKR